MNTNITLKTALLLGMTFFMVSCEKKEISSGREDVPTEHEVRKAEEEAKSNPLVTQGGEKIVSAVTAGGEVEKSAGRLLSDPVPAASPRRNTVVNEDVSEQRPYEIVTDPASIEVAGGGPGPERGEKIYAYALVPRDGCGTYWVRTLDGKVNQLVGPPLKIRHPPNHKKSGRICRYKTARKA